MNTFVDALQFIFDPANWTGEFNSIPVRLVEHIQMTVYAVLAAAAIAVPVGIFVGHTRRYEFTAVTIGNLGRALPSFGILAFFFSLTFIAALPGAIGFWPTLIALFFLAVPPILTNTYVGIKGVDQDTLEAARGMGMSEWEVLRQIELPLALPLMIAGLRIAATQVVATATLAALGGWGGLGRFIIDGRNLGENGQVEVLAGAMLVALLAIATEALLGLVERVASPRTARGREGKPTRLWRRGGGEPTPIDTEAGLAA